MPFGNCGCRSSRRARLWLARRPLKDAISTFKEAKHDATARDYLVRLDAQ